jgi:hypothetical protein
MLHVGGTGLLKHMFGCLDNLIGGPNSKKKQESFDNLHHCLVRDAEQQRERDFLCMSIQNGITDGTKICGSERVDLCVTLCHAHSFRGKVYVEGNER